MFVARFFLFLKRARFISFAMLICQVAIIAYSGRVYAANSNPPLPLFSNADPKFQDCDSAAYMSQNDDSANTSQFGKVFLGTTISFQPIGPVQNYKYNG